MKKPSLLVTHPWMARGGSEATAMWTLEALSPEFEITFVTAAPMNGSDWETLNLAYGTSVDPSRLRVVKAPVIPGAKGPRTLPHLQVRWFERFCHSLAPDFDLCLSAYNPIWFGRPSIQLIGDFSFSEEMRRRLQVDGTGPFRHRPSPLRNLYLSLGQWIEISQPPLGERGDLILANSTWAATQLREHFHLPDPAVLHPPVPLPATCEPRERAPSSFVALGRVVPEKEIERMIAILDAVRTLGFPLSFTLVGHLDDSDYSRRIADLAAARDWINIPGFLELEAKQHLLASHTFGLHACRIEAFGIAVAEMAAAGCVTFIPTSGGTGEIVPFPELQYATEEEAVEKISALLRDPARVEALAGRMPDQVAQFAPARFAEKLQGIVRRFLDNPGQAVHATTTESLSAAH